MSAPVDTVMADGAASPAATAPAATKPPKMSKKDKKKGGGTQLALMNPQPEYIAERNEIFDRLMARYQEEVAGKPREAITVTLPDGKAIDAKSWETSPYDIAHGISQSLAERTVIAKVNGELWDLDRPFESSCSLELLDFNHDDGKQVFWHSSAHILGESLERVYGSCLCYGPPIENGFYYDMYSEKDPIKDDEYASMDKINQMVTKEKQKFERLEMTKEDLLSMFAYNKFKLRILNEKVTTPTTTVYRCGTLIDLCRGPHVRDTGKVKAMTVTKSSASFWEGKPTAENLQRVYGISFPDNKLMKEWKHMMEEAAKRDHRRIGKDQELFFFSDVSPGSCFFLPHGARIYNKLMELIKTEYHTRGFSEVISPNMFNIDLWKTSGHWDHYQDNMFTCGGHQDEGTTYALKPMNCPGHAIMFKSRTRSWRELPLRYADFGVLHRNEIAGALVGLTRVRRFQQDDAHIFCALDQIESEINASLEFVRYIYDIFGFSFTLKLSTRPDDYMGERSIWDDAEEQLKSCLNAFTSDWKLNEGDGAFYGPKIDITIKDAIGRQHQCATIQLDFNLPKNFDLQYQGHTEGEWKRPVMVHRAVLGSVERCIAILTESFGGRWPFWLNPRQVMVVPVGKGFNEYGEKVRAQLHTAGFYVDCDDGPNTLPKKIRNAQIAQYNFILVVGQTEIDNGTVNIRSRENIQLGELTVDDCIAKLKANAAKYSKENNFE
eukprot:CFRG7839T1